MARNIKRQLLYTIMNILGKIETAMKTHCSDFRLEWSENVFQMKAIGLFSHLTRDLRLKRGVINGSHGWDFQEEKEEKRERKGRGEEKEKGGERHHKSIPRQHWEIY